jgi:hypothetical protein
MYKLPIQMVMTHCLFPHSKRRPLKSGLWIRIGSGFNDFVDPDPEGKKKKKIQNIKM